MKKHSVPNLPKSCRVGREQRGMWTSGRNWVVGAVLGCVATGLLSGLAVGAPLQGKTGEAGGAGWRSSWITLEQPLNFKKGDKLRIQVHGDAENVLVRLLPAGMSPASSAGVEGSLRSVPSSGLLEVVFERDHPNVLELSIHSGKEAWGKPLSGSNGTARIMTVDYLPR